MITLFEPICLKCNEPSYNLGRQESVENEDGFHIENQECFKIYLNLLASQEFFKIRLSS